VQLRRKGVEPREIDDRADPAALDVERPDVLPRALDDEVAQESDRWAELHRCLGKALEEVRVLRCRLEQRVEVPLDGQRPGDGAEIQADHRDMDVVPGRRVKPGLEQLDPARARETPTRVPRHDTCPTFGVATRRKPRVHALCESGEVVLHLRSVAVVGETVVLVRGEGLLPACLAAE